MESASPFASPRLALPILLVAGLAAYSNTFSVPFQFDDGIALLENPAARSLGAFLRSPWTPSRWLGWLTFALNGSLGGTTPAGYHAFNLALHLAVAVLVYFLARLVVALRHADGATPAADAGVGPLLAALLFALHPLQTQAVTYVVQRFASLAAAFYVAAVLLHGHAVLAGLAGDRRRAFRLRAGVLVAAALALLSKESAATVPAALALFDLLFCPGTARERVRRLLPPLAVAAVLAVLILTASRNVEAVTRQFERDVSPGGLPAWLAYLATQPGVLLAYLRLFLLPLGQSIDHDFVVASSLVARTTLAPAAGLLLLLGIPVAASTSAWRRSGSWPARLPLFGIGWFLAALAVESSVIPLSDVMVEHRMYLPIAGLAVALGLAFQWVVLDRLDPSGGGRTRLVALGGVAALLLALGAATVARNRVWQDPERLWTEAMERAPLRPRSYNWLGRMLTARGENERAIAVLERGRALPRPGFETLVNLGSAYGAAGRAAESEAAYRQALAMPGGDNPMAHLGVAQHLLDRGAVQEACFHILAAVERAPRQPTLRANAAACRLQAGDVAGAARDWRQLVAEDPADLESAFNLAGALDRLGDRPGAAAAYRSFLAGADGRYGPQRALAESWLAAASASPASRGGSRSVP